MISFRINIAVNRDRKIELQLPSEVSEGDHEAFIVIDENVGKPKRGLNDFVGAIDWTVDGLDYQRQIRSEWGGE